MKPPLEQRIKVARAMLEGARRHARQRPRPALARYIADCRARLERILDELPEQERRRRELLAGVAGDAYMTKRLADRLEIYDDRHRPIGELPADVERELERELEGAGKINQGTWPGYRGGRSRAPGLARWWRIADDAR